SAVLLPVWTKIELCFEVVAQFEHRVKPFAFPAAKTAQWPDLFVTHESFELVAAQQAASDGFPNREIAVLVRAGEALESFDDWRAALGALAERLGVGHVLVGMKMFGFADDFFCELADIAHERVARQLAMLDLV